MYGKKFRLVTDHAALSLLRNNKDPHYRLARWVAQLQSFEFDVVYKHQDADCLSRLVAEKSPTSNTEGLNNEIIRAVFNVAS